MPRFLRLRRPSRTFLIALGCVAILSGGAATALAVQEPFVYDSVIGETVPSNVDASLQAAIGNPNDPTGDGARSSGRPPTDSGTITPVNLTTGAPPPFSSDVQTPVNVFTMNDGTTEHEIYAGLDSSDGTSGSIIDQSISMADGNETAVTTDVAGSGSLTIERYSAGILTMMGSNGQEVKYNVGTRALATPECPLTGCKPPPHG